MRSRSAAPRGRPAVRQLLARGHVEHEDEPVREADRVQHPRLRDACERDPGEHGRVAAAPPASRSRACAHPRSVQDAGEQAEERERQERREGHDADVERGMRDLQAEPAHGDALHPRAGLGDDLTAEEEAVVVVLEAGEGRVSTSSSDSGSIAASTAASCSSVSPRRRVASHAVRRERTRRRTRDPSSVSVRPTRRLSSELGVRVTRPSRCSRSTWFDIAGALIFSLAASSRTPMPGWYFIATSSDTCWGETPTSRASRRSSRPTWRRTGRRRSAIWTVSSLVSGISLTWLTVARVCRVSS